MRARRARTRVLPDKVGLVAERVDNGEQRGVHHQRCRVAFLRLLRRPLRPQPLLGTQPCAWGFFLFFGNRLHVAILVVWCVWTCRLND